MGIELDSPVKRVWAVHRDGSDRYSERGTDLCATPELAKEVAADSGWDGEDAPVLPLYVVSCGEKTYLLADAQPVTVSSTMQEVRQRQRETVRRRALEKLTPEERVVLGV